MASITGDITLMSLNDLALWIGNRQMSGVLQVQQADYNGRFVIRDGALVQAKSSDPREYLGQHLINFGYISEEDLGKAYVTQQETHIPLGRILVMVGALTQSSLDRALLFKARESFLNVLTFSDGSFRYSDEKPDDDLDTTVPMLLHEICSEAAAREVMWNEMRRVFPADAVQFDVLIDDDKISGVFDKRLVSQLREGRSLGQAGLELRASNFHTYARVYDLFQRKLIRPRLKVQPSLLPSGSFPRPKPTPSDEQATKILAPPAQQKTAPEKSSVPAPVSGALPRPETPSKALPIDELRLAVNAHDWSRALILAERIIERNAQHAEANAVRRVALVQLRKLEDSGIRDSPPLDKNSTPALQVPRAEVAQAHLTSKERYVLARIDGERTLNQIAAVCPVTEPELHRIVSQFIQRGILSLVN